MAFRAWICETCRAFNISRSDIWHCPGCNRECCEKCFDRYAHCKPCSAGKTDEELRLAANATNDFDFDPPEVIPPAPAAREEE